jgi:hypothetical protein
MTSLFFGTSLEVFVVIYSIAIWKYIDKPGRNEYDRTNGCDTCIS